MRKLLIVLALAATQFPASVKAVTYGDFVDSPQIQYPEVVPVWVSGNLCTGTLIEQQIVLTAAHCIYGRPGPIQIAVGGASLNSGKLIDVTATWYHPRYDASFLQNDIALLHLNAPANVARLASLPSSGAKKPKNFTMAGWGDDQNGRLTGNLSTLNLNDQGLVATKVFRGLYNPRTMIGAGRFFPNEALYGGGCEGDSGGPLYKGRNGSTRVLVGVTSWGAEGCIQFKPTIFTWVSYYVPELLPAISQVKSRAIQNPLPTGRATPVGIGPTTTTIRTISTTTTTTIRPISTTATSSTTTTARPTTTTASSTTTLSIADLRLSLSHRTSTLFGRGTDLDITVSTDASALPTRLCVSVQSNGAAWPWFNIFGGGNWQDLGGGCLRHIGTKGPFNNYYHSPEIQESAGVQNWTATVTVSDTLGRSSSANYSWSS
jgi:secreted trypsin-like serine protease